MATLARSMKKETRTIKYLVLYRWPNIRVGLHIQYSRSDIERVGGGNWQVK